MYKTLLNVKDVAKILNVSQFTVRQEIYRRRLPFIRVGRRVMVSPEDLEDYLKARRIPAWREEGR